MSVAWLVVAGTAGGAIGFFSGIPGGPLLGALVATACMRNLVKVPDWPRWGFVVGQLLIGSASGAMVTRATLVELTGPMLVGVVVSLGVGIVGCGFGLLLARVTNSDPWSGVVAFAPGGLSELYVVASDFGVKTELMLAVHLVRRMVTVLVVVIVAAMAVPS